MNNSVNRFALNVYQTAWLLNRFALGTPLAEVVGGLSRDTFEKAKDDVSTSKDSKPKASEVRFNNENGMGGGVSDANHDTIVKGTTLPVKTITLTSMDIVGEDMIPLNCKNVPDHPNLAENERRDDNAQADARNEVEAEVDVDPEERIKKGYRDTSLDTISSESEGRTPKSSPTLSDRLYIGDIAKEVNSEEHSASSSKKCYCTNVEVHLAAFHLASEHAVAFKKKILDYAEEWTITIKSRVNSRLLEFERLKKNVDHYHHKVKAISQAVKKLKAQGNDEIEAEESYRSFNTTDSSASLFTVFDDFAKDYKTSVLNKKVELFERNRLKLIGALEAHKIFGNSLVLLLDEVTTRYWKELLPLLFRTIRFDTTQSIEHAEIFDIGEENGRKLEDIAMKKGVPLNGRLKLLKYSSFLHDRSPRNAEI